MEYFISIMSIMFIVLIIINKDYLKYLWREHVNKDFDENNPHFCFECNQETCFKCKPLKLWGEGKTKEAEEKFYDDKMNQ